MESDVDTAIRWSKRLEGLLELNLGATGKGLHQKIDSVQAQLTGATQRKLRYIATIRNKIVHEDSYSRIVDRAGFERACSEAAAELVHASKSRDIVPMIRQSPRAFAPFRATTVHRTHKRSSPEANSIFGSILQRDSLSPLFSTVGAIVGFAIPVVREEGNVAGFLCGFIGAVAGYYWRLTTILALLALIIAAGIWRWRGPDAFHWLGR